MNIDSSSPENESATGGVEHGIHTVDQSAIGSTIELQLISAIYRVGSVVN